MTVFSTPCCKNADRRGPSWGLAQVWRLVAALWLAICLLPMAKAAEITVNTAQVVPSDEAYVLNAEYRIDLGQALEDVVAHGVPLYFIVEFELTRPRWYWLNETLSEQSRSYRLSYHALTRQYRLSIGTLYQNYNSLADALAVLGRIRNWKVADKNALKSGEVYIASARLRLDGAQLPKPLQVSALINREWSLGDSWHRWYVVGGEPK